MNERECTIRIITFAERGAYMGSLEILPSPHLLPGQELI